MMRMIFFVNRISYNISWIYRLFPWYAKYVSKRIIAKVIKEVQDLATQATACSRSQFGIFTVVRFPMRKFLAFKTHPIGKAASGTGNG